jgi:hypothetical protein
VPLVGVWHDGAFVFCTGREQKQRNLDANQHVAVTTGTTGASGWNVGKDIVVEGKALRVTAAEALHELADAWFAMYGEVRGPRRGFRRNEPFLPKYRGRRRVYRVKPAKVIAFGDAHGQPPLPLLTRQAALTATGLRPLHPSQ